MQTSARPARQRLVLRAAVTAIAGVTALGAIPAQAGYASGNSLTPQSIQRQDVGHHAGSGLAANGSGPAVTPAVTGTLRGLDVSGYQSSIDWASVAAAGASFAYIKATESTNYVSGSFASQYSGSAAAGLIRGAYHFAHPNASTGAAQADYFINNGGGWTADGKTLPGALDIEYNPGSGGTCYGLSQSAMVSWVSSFVTEYQARTGRYPAIYTTSDWWTSCTGNYSGFAANDPLWIARYATAPGTLPAGWGSYTFWQNDDAGPFPGDQDVFNGSAADLSTFAIGSYTPPPAPVSWPYVQEGATGRRVTTVQYLLNAHGAKLTVDGIFGSGTRAAVVSFQTGNGLEADGIVGPDTWTKLIVTVSTGSTGPAVKAAQAELNAHGAALTVDGEFGAATQSAVQAYQTTHGLPVDGIVATATWQSLVA